MSTRPFHRTQAQFAPERPAPIATVGVVGWVRRHLLSTWWNTALTFAGLYVLWITIPPVVTWAWLQADVAGVTRFDCTGSGACWAWVDQRIGQFLYGFYPAGETWRVNLAVVLMVPALIFLLFEDVPGARWGRWYALAFPVIAGVLLIGGLGLAAVPTSRFGGFMLNLVIGLAGIVLSLPFGILLALGRRSQLPAVRVLSIAFIEVFRGVPLITFMFTAALLLPVFLPPHYSLDLVARVIVVVTMYAAAYIAEVIRGGLQAIPRGQYEAAQALGLGYWQSMRLIILPQALKISIPGIVNTFIALFKDTTLVIVIGLFDILNIGNSMVANPDWQGLGTEAYAFIAVFFFVICFGMSRYSMHLERRLDTGAR